MRQFYRKSISTAYRCDRPAKNEPDEPLIRSALKHRVPYSLPQPREGNAGRRRYNQRWWRLPSGALCELMCVSNTIAAMASKVIEAL